MYYPTSAELGDIHATQAVSTSKNEVEATLTVPYRPQLFGKSKPIVINLSRTALAKDEVFLILAFIYCEYRRQEKTVSCPLFAGSH